MDRRSFLKGLTAAFITAPLKAPVVVRFEEEYIKKVVTGFSTPVNVHLIRSQIWNRQIKEMLLDDLQSMKFIRILD